MAWPTIRLGDVCVINPRLHRTALPTDNQAVSFVPMASVDEVQGRIANPLVREYASVKKGFTPFAENDVIFAKITPCMENGKAAIARGLVGGLGFGSTEFHVLRATPQVLPEYVYYFVRQEAFRRNAKANFTGTGGQQRVPATFIADSRIPLPPLAEQQRIVDILDRAAAIQRLRRAAEEKAREIIPALFVDMFGDPATNPKGWPVGVLKEAAGIGSGITKGRRIEGRAMIEVPYLRVANVQDGFLDLNEIKTIEIMASEREKYALEPGDIVMTEGGDLDKLGRGYVWNGELPYCAHQNHVFRVRANRAVLEPMFLASFIQSYAGKAYFLRVAKRTTGIASINKTQLGDLPLWMPPIELQRQFAERASAIKAVSTLHADAAVQSQSFAGALAAQLLG
jgi:type I restriction enzyme S subunit